MIVLILDGEKILKLRQKKGLTAVQVQRAVKIPASQLCRFERGELTGATLTTLGKLCKALECTPESLLKWEEV